MCVGLVPLPERPRPRAHLRGLVCPFAQDYSATSPKSSQAIASFLKQYYSPKDLSHFQDKYDLPDKPITKVVGDNDASRPGVEADLDVEYIAATGRNVDTWFVYTDETANGGQEDFVTWVVGQLNTTDSPWVHSVSYGDVESTIGDAYKARLSMEFQKFGISGRSVLVAAGDNGVGCADGTFAPDWPTSSPFVTSVGGTESGLTSLTEKVWPDGGGGFSDFYAQPSYQTAAVAKYLASGKAPAAHYFNKTSRAYPGATPPRARGRPPTQVGTLLPHTAARTDVAAFANDVVIVYRGIPMPVAGTSCATPMFAGVVAALNDVRFNAGRSSLGFLNPLLYKIGAEHPTAFQDITDGSNPQGECPGFEATTGWDPASGWGSPNFAALQKLV